MCKMIHRLAQAEKERDNVKSNWNEARKLEADLAKAFAEIADLKAKLAEDAEDNRRVNKLFDGFVRGANLNIAQVIQERDALRLALGEASRIFTMMPHSIQEDLARCGFDIPIDKFLTSMAAYPSDLSKREEERRKAIDTAVEAMEIFYDGRHKAIGGRKFCDLCDVHPCRNILLNDALALLRPFAGGSK